MPDRKPNYKDPEFVKFLNQMKIIGITESGNDYNAKSSVPGQTATGKYQYNSSHLDTIKKFSRDIGMPVNNLEEFRSNPGLQEAYFTYDQYKAYSWAKSRIASKNPFNYNLAELAALRHFQGEKGADTILKTGEHKGSDKKLKNPGTKEYIENRFRPQLKQSGLYTDPGTDKNMERAKSLPNSDKLKIQDDYFKEQKIIKDSNFDSITENTLLRQLNQKYFDAGNLEIINHKIDYRNNDSKVKNFKGFDKKYLDDKGNLKIDYRDNINIKDLKDLDLNKPPKPKINRINLNEYIRDIPSYNEDSSVNESSDTTQVIPGSSPQEKAIAQNNDPTQPNVPVQKDQFKEEELMNILDGNQGLFQDEQFKYKPGMPNIPFEAIGSLVAGMKGIEAGNVDIPHRDEEVSAGLRNYGAELQRIKQMGLPPELEAELKTKAANVYQTGLTNIVRASGGNRNLVLGNQGQLDMVRQSAITDIALMDLDRRDKAMADYGELMKYMDQFYANRDIANNERDYNEAIKEQIAGSQLAAQGFSSFINSLQYARENGPGSANDMYKQYLQYSITGVNPGIDDDGSGTVPGTPSYAEAQKTVIRNRQTEQQKIKSFYSSQDKEGKKEFNTFLKENESLRPDINKDVTFDQFKSEFDNYTGDAENKDFMQLEQNVLPESNIISLTDEEVMNPKSDRQPMPLLNAFGPEQPIGATGTQSVGMTPETQAATDKFRGSVTELENYLNNEGKKATEDLDSLINKTETDTQQMNNQIQNIY